MEIKQLNLLVLQCLIIGILTSGDSTIILTNQNFDELTGVQNELNGTWFIMFYAPWCPHCKNILGTWDQLNEILKGQVNVGLVDCDKETEIRDRFSIQGYPTLLLLKDGQMHEYAGKRDIQLLKEFALEQYKDVQGESIPKEISQQRSFLKVLQRIFGRFKQQIKINPITSFITIISILFMLVFTCFLSDWAVDKLENQFGPKPKIDDTTKNINRTHDKTAGSNEEENKIKQD